MMLNGTLMANMHLTTHTIPASSHDLSAAQQQSESNPLSNVSGSNGISNSIILLLTTSEVSNTVASLTEQLLASSVPRFLITLYVLSVNMVNRSELQTEPPLLLKTPTPLEI